MEINYSSPEFIQKLKIRDETTITHLVKKYSKSLYRAAMAQGLAEDQIEEVLQATWDAFFMGMERFEGRSHIRTYLFGILYNKIKEYWRSQKRFVDTYAQSQQMNQQNSDGSTSAGYDPVVDGQFDNDNQWTYSPIEPHRFSEATETMGLIEECMEGLTPQQKMAFYLREVDGESTDAVCSILSVTNTNLRVLIYRAKNRLRKCLEGRFAEEPIEGRG